MTISDTSNQRLRISSYQEIIMEIVSLCFPVLHTILLLQSGGMCIMLCAFAGLPILLLPVVFGYLLFAIAKKWSRFDHITRLIHVSLLSLMLGNIIFFFPPIQGGLLLEDFSLKKRITKCWNIDVLQTWAINMLEIYQHAGYIELSPERLPQGISCGLDPGDITITQRVNDEERSVMLMWGGGLGHYGLLIGHPSYMTKSWTSYWVHQWQPGVYGFYEL